ncbi:F-box only protein 43 isoform X2 [Macrotis lagotis]|uniref:F-box only protein 43 isoform X2 n=1 Tax=Macrotis lagotis TaxID=92651 RepID=UPI003D68941F
MSDSHSIEASEAVRNGVESPNISLKFYSSGGFSSTSSFQDSGYSDSLKASSFDYTDVENIEKNAKDLSSTQEYSENYSLGFTCSIDSPVENKNSESFFSKEENEVAELCETPKITKKKTFFRRRLNITNIVSRGDTEHFETQNCSLGKCAKTTPISQPLSFEERVSKRALVSPQQTIFTPVVTSTLKVDEITSNSQKLRLSFSQHKTSTIDDSKSDCSLFEVDCISPIQGSNCTDALTSDFGDSILSINGETIGPEVLGSSSCEAPCETNEDIFITPINNLVANIKFGCYSPAEVIGNISTPEDSGFNSLGLDKSQDSFSDHEGSFQDLFPKPLGNGRSLGTKRKPINAGRVRRLSTLREHSSQSETEEDKPLVNSGLKAKITAASGNSSNEQIIDNSGDSVLGLKDLSKTPALQLIHEIITKSKKKRFQQTGVKNHLKDVEGEEVSVLEYVLAGLIGKKMGLEKLDILTELKFRNLKHILAMVLEALTVENLCSVWRVSKNWREIVMQDKKANQRRKVYIQQLKADSRENILYVEDAATRLNLLNRSALRSVQAQARTPGSQKEVSTPSPWGQVLTPKERCSVTQLPSKQEEYVKDYYISSTQGNAGDVVNLDFGKAFFLNIFFIKDFI